jgi:hypothetical protein
MNPAMIDHATKTEDPMKTFGHTSWFIRAWNKAEAE